MSPEDRATIERAAKIIGEALVVFGTVIAISIMMHGCVTAAIQ